MRSSPGLVMLCLVSLAASPAGFVENPQYIDWAKFPSGSSATSAIDVSLAAGPVHIEMTTTLRSVNQEDVELEINTQRTAGGRMEALPPQHVTYRRWLKQSDLKQIADQDVTWNGKTLHCRVYESPTGVIGDPQQHGTSTIYLSDSVPGGVVKSELPTTNGKPAISSLKSYTVANAAQSVAATPPASTASFGDFSFGIPSGWKQIASDRSHTAAMLLLKGETWNDADGMIKVDVGKPTNQSTQATATALAGKDGKVLPDPLHVDGIDALKVETPSTDMSRPKFVAVLFRNDKVYLIMAAGARGTDVSAAFDQVIKSWHWESAKPIEQAEKPTPHAAGKLVDLLAGMKGQSLRSPDGSVVLDKNQSITASETFNAPCTFRIVAMTHDNDFRVGGPADQIIFNWEMNHDELRVDGGPANGQHKKRRRPPRTRSVGRNRAYCPSR